MSRNQVNPGMHDLFGDTTGNLSIFADNQKEKMRDATARRGQDMDAMNKAADRKQRMDEVQITQEGWEKQRQHESGERDKDRTHDFDTMDERAQAEMVAEQEKAAREQADYLLKQKILQSQSRKAQLAQEEAKRARAAHQYEIQTSRRKYTRDLKDATNEAHDLDARMTRAQTTYTLTQEGWKTAADTANSLFNNEIAAGIDAQRQAGTKAAQVAKDMVRAEAGKAPAWYERMVGRRAGGNLMTDRPNESRADYHDPRGMIEQLPMNRKVEPKEVAANIVDTMVQSGALNKLSGSPDQAGATQALKNYFAAQFQLQGVINNGKGQPLEDNHPDVQRFQQAAKALASTPGMAGIAVREFVDDISEHFSTMAENMTMAVENRGALTADQAKDLPEWITGDGAHGDEGTALREAFGLLGASAKSLDTYANSVLPHADLEKESMVKLAKSIIAGLDGNPDQLAKQHPAYKKAFQILAQNQAQLQEAREKKKFAEAELGDTTSAIKGNIEKQRAANNALEDFENSPEVLDEATGLSDDYTDIMKNQADEEDGDLKGFVDEADKGRRESFERQNKAYAERKARRTAKSKKDS